MAYVAQKHKTDCGIAVLAMLCDVTYEEANRAIPWRREGVLNGTTSTQLIEGGIKLGFDINRPECDHLNLPPVPEGTKEGDLVTFEIWNQLPNNSLVKIAAPLDGHMHWVAWRKGKVYDPARGVFSPHKYDNFPAGYLEFCHV